MANRAEIDVRGLTWILASNREAYAYDSAGNRTSTRDGVSVQVACPELSFDKFSIKLPGQDTLLFEENDDIPPMTFVAFSGLHVYPYVRDGRLAYTASADSVRLVDSKSASASAVK